MGTLYIVATPIGNLKDITERAKDVLAEVDLVLAEEVDRARNLLRALHISSKVVRYHQHSSSHKKDRIGQWLEEGKDLALVSSAGTPGLSDPGNELIHYLREKDVSVVPIPGVSALSTAVSICGFPMNQFLFLGFPPKKKKESFFDDLFEIDFPVVLFESSHRILKTLQQIQLRNPEQQIFVGRELTKKFESTYYGRVTEVVDQLGQDQIKGEFVIVINTPQQIA